MFKITSVSIYGADNDIAPSLQSATEAAISGSYFGLFSKSNAFIYPRGAVVRAVQDASGRVYTVRTSLNDLHQISVSITEKTPVAIACPDFPSADVADSDDVSGVEVTPDEHCYFMDKSGFIYSTAPDTSANAYHRYYVPNVSTASSSDSYIGNFATSTEEFAELQSFYDGSQAAGLEVQSILIKEKGEYEMYILNPDKSIAIIYFNNARPFATELSNLVSFWTYMVTDVATTKKPPSFDYIDVRYGTNVFYRENGGAASTASKTGKI